MEIILRILFLAFLLCACAFGDDLMPETQNLDAITIEDTELLSQLGQPVGIVPEGLELTLQHQKKINGVIHWYTCTTPIFCAYIADSGVLITD